MTTHYSGVGTAEAAMSQVVDAVQCSSGEGGLVAFSAADVDVGCRSILLAHVPPHAPAMSLVTSWGGCRNQYETL